MMFYWKTDEESDLDDDRFGQRPLLLDGVRRASG